MTIISFKINSLAYFDISLASNILKLKNFEKVFKRCIFAIRRGLEIKSFSFAYSDIFAIWKGSGNLQKMLSLFSEGDIIE